eukprot:scaffold33557_cov101-Isochrysis_galbana.AAC.2
MGGTAHQPSRPPVTARCQALPSTHLSDTDTQQQSGTSNPGRPARAVNHPTLNLKTFGPHTAHPSLPRVGQHGRSPTRHSIYFRNDEWTVPHRCTTSSLPQIESSAHPDRRLGLFLDESRLRPPVAAAASAAHGERQARLRAAAWPRCGALAGHGARLDGLQGGAADSAWHHGRMGGFVQSWFVRAAARFANRQGAGSGHQRDVVGRGRAAPPRRSSGSAG